MLLAVAGDAINEAFLGAVIEGDITGDRAAAKDADFARALRADAAGGEIGHAAVGEAEPGIGDVLGLAEDGNADGLDTGHSGAHQTEHDIQIVNHQVQHNADVGAAIGEGGKAIGFNEARIGGDLLQVGQDGIEAFDVPDL